MSLINFLKRKLKKKYRVQARKDAQFRKLFDQFQNLCTPLGLTLDWDDRMPCVHDANSATSFDAHYIYHTNWAARQIRKTAPTKHVDISSITYFSTMLSAFIPVDFYEYRPAPICIEGLNCSHVDILNLPFDDNSLDSLSCMHVIEHIGLGRYGEPYEPTGDSNAIRELIRVVKPGGSLYFVVPVGKPRICFNAHRIYSYEQITEQFKDFTIREFGLIKDDRKNEQGELVNDGVVVDKPELVSQQDYGCGCWHFIKKIKTQ